MYESKKSFRRLIRVTAAVLALVVGAGWFQFSNAKSVPADPGKLAALAYDGSRPYNEALAYNGSYNQALAYNGSYNQALAYNGSYNEALAYNGSQARLASSRVGLGSYNNA